MDATSTHRLEVEGVLRKLAVNFTLVIDRELIN
jgi:hypothetical protein